MKILKNSSEMPAWIQSALEVLGKKSIASKSTTAAINVHDLPTVSYKDETFYVNFVDGDAILYNAYGNEVRRIEAKNSIEEVNDELNKNEVVATQNNCGDNCGDFGMECGDTDCQEKDADADRTIVGEDIDMDADFDAELKKIADMETEETVEQADENGISDDAGMTEEPVIASSDKFVSKNSYNRLLARVKRLEAMLENGEEQVTQQPEEISGEPTEQPEEITAEPSQSIEQVAARSAGPDNVMNEESVEVVAESIPNEEGVSQSVEDMTGEPSQSIDDMTGHISEDIVCVEERGATPDGFVGECPCEQCQADMNVNASLDGVHNEQGVSQNVDDMAGTVTQDSSELSDAVSQGIEDMAERGAHNNCPSCHASAEKTAELEHAYVVIPNQAYDIGAEDAEVQHFNETAENAKRVLDKEHELDITKPSERGKLDSSFLQELMNVANDLNSLLENVDVEVAEPVQTETETEQVAEEEPVEDVVVELPDGEYDVVILDNPEDINAFMEQTCPLCGENDLQGEDMIDDCVGVRCGHCNQKYVANQSSKKIATLIKR